MNVKSLLAGFFMMLMVNASAQLTFKESFDYLSKSITTLPYNGIKIDGQLLPDKSVYFHTEAINSNITSTIWSDIQLTQSIPNDYQIESLYRRFNPTNGNYRIGVVLTGVVDLAKKVLVTVSSEGEFIDALKVNVYGYHSKAAENIHILQWKIDENMKVTTYRIKPTQTTPIPFDNRSDSFYGQRIDTEYQVTSEGRFVRVKETTYISRTYTYTYLADTNCNFWEGNEVKIN